MPERFRKRRWRGEVLSSEGFSIRLNGRTSLTYKDETGEIQVSSEAMAGPGITVAVYSESIAETSERSRSEVMDNIARAFQFAGWTLIPS